MEIQFDSKEEMYMYWYLEELKENGYIKYFDIHPPEFKLSDGLKIDLPKNKSKTILREHIYTPDYIVEWSDKAYGIFFEYIDGEVDNKKIPFLCVNKVSYIEVKPSFDKQNMTRLFKINQKWIWETKKKYVQLIKPIGKKDCLFEKTFTPKRYLKTDKTNINRTINWKVVSIDEFIKGDTNAV